LAVRLAGGEVVTVNREGGADEYESAEAAANAEAFFEPEAQPQDEAAAEDAPAKP
jgi:hypothetical protein